MSRFITTISLLAVLSSLVPEKANAQNVDPAQARKLTVEQANELLKRPNSLRLNVAELSPEAAAVLARYKGDIRFDALTTLVPEAAAALATNWMACVQLTKPSQS